MKAWRQSQILELIDKDAVTSQEVLREQLQAGRSFDAGIEAVAAQCVLTTHTPVAAGHDAFVDLLKKHDIQVLTDTRSSPYSKFVPQFNREELERALKEFPRQLPSHTPNL